MPLAQVGVAPQEDLEMAGLAAKGDGLFRVDTRLLVRGVTTTAIDQVERYPSARASSPSVVCPGQWGAVAPKTQGRIGDEQSKNSLLET